MTESNLPAIRSFLPSEGTAFRTVSESPLHDVSTDLCQIASFLQRHDPSSTLNRFHDWWEHDGLHFPNGSTDFHGLFNSVGTPRSLIESMSGDNRVFIAFSPQNRDWYLRFFADWDEGDANLIGEYSITLARSLIDLFSADVMSSLKCPIVCEDMFAYFGRIEA